MKDTVQTPAGAADAPATRAFEASRTATITVGVLCWIAASLGFLGLKFLMRERPEFMGQPARLAMGELVQESPQWVARRASDDLSVVRPIQPESADVRFDLRGRRDYRGLRTILDMSGDVQARYVVTNAFEEPLFVLFKCPHPRVDSASGEALPAGGLRLQASVPGIQENAKAAWLWSGTLEPHASATVEVSYQVASLKGVAYRIRAQDGNPVKRVRVTLERRDLASMRFESSDGNPPLTGDSAVWERRDFLAPDYFAARIVETRSLFGSLTQLLEMGPLVSLLFLLSVSAIILTRQAFSPVQVLTIAAGYTLYFPLMLYLSTRFSFAVALAIAVAAPGALLVNYARWLIGARLGWVGAPVLLGLYWVFPTLAAFSGWNRGMVLLCLGVVTLGVLINLQNQALRRQALAAVAVACLGWTSRAGAGEVQVVVPGELAGRLWNAPREPAPAVVAFEPVEYQVGQEGNQLRVLGQAKFRVLRGGEAPVPVLAGPAYLRAAKVEAQGTNPAAALTVSNRLSLYAPEAGTGTLRFECRAPAELRDGKRRAQIPLVPGVSGHVRLTSPQRDLELPAGGLWESAASGDATVYEIDVAGEPSLAVEWPDRGAGAAATGAPGESPKEFYGIGLTQAQHLTVVNSDSSCTHFAEFELPASQASEFRLRLPPEARLISVSVNANEIGAPAVRDQWCAIRLPGREVRQAAHRLSFRIAYPAVRLGFLGTLHLTLPEVVQTTGTLEWVVVLPDSFQAQVVSSGLERRKTAPDLSRFGDYGRILKSHTPTYLAKDLTPPGRVELSLKYRQAVPGLSDAAAD